jgi:DNA processing protein
VSVDTDEGPVPAGLDESESGKGSLPLGFPEGSGEGGAERDALLLLACLIGSADRLRVLIWREGSASAAVRAIRSGNAGTEGDRAFLSSADPDEIRSRLQAAGARVAPPGHEDYWPALIRLTDPPVALFARGQPLGPGDLRIAVVGTRRPSRVGAEVAADIGAGLAATGAVVVSGGALGIDAIAHRAALDAGGRTVAILGSGIDRDTPRTNAPLLRRIESQGTILSEFGPGVEAMPHFFPYRNRLIAALSRAVVVVEGNERSGTRTTAARALDLGVPIYAVPGPVNSSLSETPHELIRSGATLIRGAEDLLGDLGLADGGTPAERGPALPPLQARAFSVLTQAMLPDLVAKEASMSLADAVEALVELELRGLVRGVGGRYERTFGGRSASHV